MMRWLRLLALTACTTWLSLLARSTAQATPPDIRWHVIETDHFSVIFDSKHYMLGALYAQAAEQAWTSVSPSFGLWPAKTVILVDDSTDIANGSATGVPFPLINALPVLPGSLDSIGDYGNWGLELITHEYTHILNFEPANGVMRPLRWIFGSIIRPNILLPRWYSEGLAVEMETRQSTFGRLRSANYLSIVRAMAEEGTLRREDISRVNEVSIPDWPGGIRPYLMGAMIWDEMVREKGDGIIGELNTAYSRRVPFFINGPVEDRFGIGYSKLLQHAYDRAEQMVQKQLLLIQAAGQPAEIELEQEGYFSHSPLISPDGQKLIWVGKEHNVDSRVFLTERPPSPPVMKLPSAPSFPAHLAGKMMVDGTSINRLSWLPDSKSFVYDSVDTFKHVYEYSDLYRFDVFARKKTRLTQGMRAREAVVSPDGKYIAFTQITPGSTQLAAVRVDGTGLSTLYTPPIQTRIARAEFLSATEIIFTEKRDDGDEVFRIVRVKEGADARLAPDGDAVRSVLNEYKPVHFPRMTRAGLLFVSDRSGVANLYLAARDLKTARAVTNSSTRLMTGEIDMKTGDLYYSKLVSLGPQLYRSSHAAWAKTPAQPPQVGPLVDSQWPLYQKPQVDVKLEAHDYSPWYYLLPRYWLPYVYVAPGVSYFQASVNAADPTGRHAYQVSAAYDSQTNASSVLGSYINQTTSVPLIFTGLNTYDYVYSGNFRRQITTLAAEGDFYPFATSDDWHASLGWDYSSTVVEPISLKRNGATASVSYRNVKQRGYEISPEKGGAFALQYTRYFPGISDLEYEVTAVSASKFLSGWILPERHVLALFLNSSIAPRLNSSLFGTTTLGGAYQTLPGLRGFVMRGYGNGVFLGRNMITASSEYRFPLLYSYRGYRTTPFFLQRWHADIFADAITLDGLVLDSVDKVYKTEKLGKPFYGVGAEAKADATVFYHIPIQFIFGMYYGTDARENPNGLFPFVGIGL